MPGQAPVVADEREQLLAYLAQQRDGLRFAAFGLTDEQARLTPTAGTLSVGGLVKHAALNERHWMDMVVGHDRGLSEQERMDQYVNGFRLVEGETLAGTLATFAEVAAETEARVRGLDLDHPVPVPKGVPWFPQDLDAWSLRWVLLHLIEETARHAGHADIVRESIDGATMYELMAGAEGWPETEWIKPWRPTS